MRRVVLPRASAMFSSTFTYLVTLTFAKPFTRCSGFSCNRYNLGTAQKADMAKRHHWSQHFTRWAALRLHNSDLTSIWCVLLWSHAIKKNWQLGIMLHKRTAPCGGQWHESIMPSGKWLRIKYYRRVQTSPRRRLRCWLNMAASARLRSMTDKECCSLQLLLHILNKGWLKLQQNTCQPAQVCRGLSNCLGLPSEG